MAGHLAWLAVLFILALLIMIDEISKTNLMIDEISKTNLYKAVKIQL